MLVVLRFGTAYALIDEYILTGGFDRSKPTYTWTVYMWDTAFQVGDQNRGYAAAIGWIGTIGMLAVVLWLFYARSGTRTDGDPGREPSAIAASAQAASRPRGRRIPPGARSPSTGSSSSLCVIILFPIFWVFLLSIKSLPDAYTNRHLAEPLRLQLLPRRR